MFGWKVNLHLPRIPPTVPSAQLLCYFNINHTHIYTFERNDVWSLILGFKCQTKVNVIDIQLSNTNINTLFSKKISNFKRKFNNETSNKYNTCRSTSDRSHGWSFLCRGCQKQFRFSSAWPTVRTIWEHLPS